MSGFFLSLPWLRFKVAEQFRFGWWLRSEQCTQAGAAWCLRWSVHGTNTQGADWRTDGSWMLSLLCECGNENRFAKQKLALEASSFSSFSGGWQGWNFGHTGAADYQRAKRVGNFKILETLIPLGSCFKGQTNGAPASACAFCQNSRDNVCAHPGLKISLQKIQLLKPVSKQNSFTTETHLSKMYKKGVLEKKWRSNCAIWKWQPTKFFSSAEPLRVAETKALL